MSTQNPNGYNDDGPGDQPNDSFDRMDLTKLCTLPELHTLAQSIDGSYWNCKKETHHECGKQSMKKKTKKTAQPIFSSSLNQPPEQIAQETICSTQLRFTSS